MRLGDAIVASKNRTAQLQEGCEIHTADTCVGNLYLWTEGHTSPLLISCRRFKHPLIQLAEAADLALCICGDVHGCPEEFELHHRLGWSEDWEPCFPLDPEPPGG